MSHAPLRFRDRDVLRYVLSDLAGATGGNEAAHLFAHLLTRTRGLVLRAEVQIELGDYEAASASIAESRVDEDALGAKLKSIESPESSKCKSRAGIAALPRSRGTLSGPLSP